MIISSVRKQPTADLRRLKSLNQVFNQIEANTVKSMMNGAPATNALNPRRQLQYSFMHPTYIFRGVQSSDRRFRRIVRQ